MSNSLIVNAKLYTSPGGSNAGLASSDVAIALAESVGQGCALPGGESVATGVQLRPTWMEAAALRHPDILPDKLHTYINLSTQMLHPDIGVGAPSPPDYAKPDSPGAQCTVGTIIPLIGRLLL